MTWNEYDWSHGFRFTAKRHLEKHYITEVLGFKSEIEKKRDRDDLVVKISSDEWDCDPSLPEGCYISRSGYGGWMPVDDYGYQIGAVMGDDSSTTLKWYGYDWAYGYEFTANRKWVDDNLAVVGQIPTRVTQLSNDACYETSSVVDLKRGKDDLSAYKVEMTYWRCDPALPEGWTIAHPYEGESGWCPVDEYGNVVGATKGDEDSKELSWIGWSEWA